VTDVGIIALLYHGGSFALTRCYMESRVDAHKNVEFAANMHGLTYVAYVAVARQVHHPWYVGRCWCGEGFGTW
jgi:hypothetical protein